MARRCAVECHHARRQSGRRPRRPIVILCEGSETEPNYLASLIRSLSLTSAILPNIDKTDPEGLVREGLDRLRSDPSIERLFVVCDCDTHASLPNAIGLASTAVVRGRRVELILSDPCFEFWLINHFEYRRAPMSPTQALNRLKKLFPEYHKGDAGCMDAIVERVETALGNTDRANADAAKTGGRNPSSKMPDLVRALMEASELA